MIQDELSIRYSIGLIVNPIKFFTKLLHTISFKSVPSLEHVMSFIFIAS